MFAQGGLPLFRPLIAAALIAAFAAPVALAGPAERLGRVDHRLTAAEKRIHILEGRLAVLLDIDKVIAEAATTWGVEFRFIMDEREAVRYKPAPARRRETEGEPV